MVLLTFGVPAFSLADETGLDLPVKDVVGVKKVPLAALGGDIEIPENWHILTPEQAQQSMAKVEFATPDAEALGAASVASVGESMISISKYPEPYTDGVNPSLSINWVKMPPEFGLVPAAQRNLVMAQVLAQAVVPTMRKTLGEQGFTLMGEPKPFEPNSRHQGAQITYRSPLKLKTGKIMDPITRTFLLFGKDYLITTSLVLPENAGDPADAATLQTMLKSFNYTQSE